MYQYRVSCIDHNRKCVHGRCFNNRDLAEDFRIRAMPHYDSVKLHMIKYLKETGYYEYRGIVFCELSFNSRYALVENRTLCKTYNGNIFNFLGILDLLAISRLKSFKGNIRQYRVINGPFDWDAYVS